MQTHGTRNKFRQQLEAELARLNQVAQDMSIVGPWELRRRASNGQERAMYEDLVRKKVDAAQGWLQGVMKTSEQSSQLEAKSLAAALRLGMRQHPKAAKIVNFDTGKVISDAVLICEWPHPLVGYDPSALLITEDFQVILSQLQQLHLQLGCTECGIRDAESLANSTNLEMQALGRRMKEAHESIRDVNINGQRLYHPASEHCDLGLWMPGFRDIFNDWLNIALIEIFPAVLRQMVLIALREWSRQERWRE